MIGKDILFLKEKTEQLESELLQAQEEIKHLSVLVASLAVAVAAFVGEENAENARKAIIEAMPFIFDMPEAQDAVFKELFGERP